jgi:DNA-binding HxlR family transcriptional regulator
MKPDGSDFDRLLLDQIADRWSILVLGSICAAGGALRFNELRRQVSGVAQKTLTQCLRRLERNGIVDRRLIDSAPPGVEYVVTPLGRTLDKPFAALNAWTAEHADAVRKAHAAFDGQGIETNCIDHCLLPVQAPPPFTIALED